MAGKKILVIDKAVMILDYIADNNNGSRLTDICADLKMVKSTAHGILLALEDNGLISKDKTNSCFSLGIKAFRYSKIFEKTFSLKDAAHPYLIKLSEKYKECAHTGLPDKDYVVYVDMIETDHAVRLQARVGGRDPLYCTSIGKTILASMSDSKVEEYFKRTKIQKKTEYTITDVEKMKLALSEIRENRISYDMEELEKGLVCVACGIYDREGELVGAIGISSPNGRVGMETLVAMGKDIRDYCDELEGILF